MSCNKTINRDVFYGALNSFVLQLSTQDTNGSIVPAPLDTIQSVTLDFGVNNGFITVLRDSGSEVINWWWESLNAGEMRFILGGFVEDNAIPIGARPVQLVTFEEPGRPGTYWASFENRDLMLNVVDE